MLNASCATRSAPSLRPTRVVMGAPSSTALRSRYSERRTGIVISAAERFWPKVVKSGDCWMWEGNRTPRGYGMFWSGERLVSAYRWAYEDAEGSVPNGMELDHLCRVHACVRPSHLEAVVHRTNILRGVGPTAINARKTHCNYGHLYSDDNLYLPPSGQRVCLTCKRRLQQGYRQRRRAR